MVSSDTHTEILEIVHPGRYIQIYRKPVMARDIMRKYPRHCITRPDVFKFPWIVVRPESVLELGEVFYLVPYTTLNKLLKEKKPELQAFLASQQKQTSKLNHSLQSIRPKSPTKSWAGTTPMYSEGYYYGIRNEQVSLDKSGFYKDWDKIQKNLDNLNDDTEQNIIRPRVTTPDRELVTTKSCLKKPNGNRKELNLKVSFLSPIEVSSSRNGSLDVQWDDLVKKLTRLRV